MDMDELNLIELRDKCLATLQKCAVNVDNYLDYNDKAEEYNKLRHCVVEHCKMELQDEASEKAIHSIEKESQVGDWDALQDLYEEKLAKYNKKPAKFDDHPYVKELDKHFKSGEGSQQDQDMDIAITQATDNHIDPISKRPITNPVRNKICKHIYQRETIDTIIRNKKNKGCPYVGCTNKQKLLVDNLDFTRELNRTILGT